MALDGNFPISTLAMRFCAKVLLRDWSVRMLLRLALAALGGQMGGRPVELTLLDDELKPDLASQKIQALLARDQVDLVVGPIFSNILQAIHRPVLESGRILISPNAGPSIYAGAQCSPYFFVVSYQNDQAHEVMGLYAQERGFRKIAFVMPNYQAGKDAVSGFLRRFQGEVVEEIYVPMAQLDLSAEMARLAAVKPDAIFTFMPGGMGVALVKAYAQSGLTGKIPLLSTFTFDEAKPEQSAIAVKAKAASIDTFNEARDKHLRGADFFNVEEFPTIEACAAWIAERGGVAFLAHPRAARTADGIERVVVDLAARHHRDDLVEQADERTQQARLRLPT